jgi:hypothetical protein
LTGWTVVLDYSGLVAVAVLSAYAFFRWASRAAPARSLAELAAFAAGVAGGAAVLMAYQWSSFGSPFYPAQHYMPPANFSDLGYSGFDWPHLDLLAETGFSLRYGLFVSAPILLLALWPPAWFAGRIRLLRGAETACVFVFVAAFFLFCAANQYGRMQFNSGVRHVVPVTPFLFLIAAGVFVRLPALVAALVGVAATYWSVCLAMYRDVEQGIGVPDSLIHITTEGFRLPWLHTVQHMGYGLGVTAAPLLGLGAALLCVIWFPWGHGARLRPGPVGWSGR